MMRLVRALFGICVICLLVVVVPGAARASGGLSASTFDVTPTGLTTATVDGSVNPNGLTTTYNVEYDLADSDWCTIGSGSPAITTTPQLLGSTDTDYHDVSVNLTGLSDGEDYCGELVATNSSGSAEGDQIPFTAGAPSVLTSGSPTMTGATTATVDGSVNPAAQTTTYKVEYDLAGSEWCASGGSSGSPTNTTASQPLGSTDATFHDVSVGLTSLDAGEGYCADLVATNGSGTGNSGQFSFTAGAPSANTNSATVTGATTATVDGDVNPAGQTTTYQVEYDLASSLWCTFPPGSPAHSTTPQTLGFTDATSHHVSVDLTGLTAGTAYCADLVATNGSGSRDGGQVSFTAGLPNAATFAATPTGLATALVEGMVNPAGQTTTYQVEYGPAISTWCTSGGSSGSPASSTTPQTLGSIMTRRPSRSILLPGSTVVRSYCADLVATNGSGSADGGQVSFTAGFPSAANPPGGGGPTTGSTTATIEGSVNPAGQTTTYKVEYDLASSLWCTSGGSSGSPAHSTTPQTLGFTDGTFHDVSVDLTGLTAGTGYCADIVATNPSGSAVSGQVSFTAGAPSAFTNSPVTVTGATTATVDGSVNPAGQTTTYEVKYGLASSLWCTSGGSSGSPASSTTPHTLGFTDATDHDVSVDLTGLTAGTAYCADLVSSNGSGSGDGGQVSFTTDAAPVMHTLTVSLGGAGSGSVSGTGVNCPGNCSHSYTTGTIVTLTAAPAAGSVFAGWSGGGCSGTSSCQVTVSSDATVTATFNKVPNLTVSLTVSKSGAGNGTVTSSPAGIACGSTCVHAFNSGTGVTLTAAPAAGSRFGGWSGGGCSGSGSCALTLNAGTTVTATFNLVPIPPQPQAKKAPQTRISKATINSKKRTATFKFVGSGSSKPYSFQCKLDKKKYSSCRSGMTYKGLKPGSHTFWVKAKNHAGRVDKTPATKKFKIKS